MKNKGKIKSKSRASECFSFIARHFLVNWNTGWDDKSAWRRNPEELPRMKGKTWCSHSAQSIHWRKCANIYDIGNLKYGLFISNRIVLMLSFLSLVTEMLESVCVDFTWTIITQLEVQGALLCWRAMKHIEAVVARQWVCCSPYQETALFSRYIFFEHRVIHLKGHFWEGWTFSVLSGLVSSVEVWTLVRMSLASEAWLEWVCSCHGKGAATHCWLEKAVIWVSFCWSFEQAYVSFLLAVGCRNYRRTSFPRNTETWKVFLAQPGTVGHTCSPRCCWPKQEDCCDWLTWVS